MPEPSRNHDSMGLPVVNPAGDVPVYDCHVILSGPDGDGRLAGRVTNLPGISAAARSERELLMQLAKRFKETIVRHRTEGTTVPWVEQPERPGEGERQRWIPVHL